MSRGLKLDNEQLQESSGDNCRETYLNINSCSSEEGEKNLNGNAISSEEEPSDHEGEKEHYISLPLFLHRPGGVALKALIQPKDPLQVTKGDVMKFQEVKKCEDINFNEKKAVCCHCQFTCNNEQDLSIHISESHKGQSPFYVCPFCRFKYKSLLKWITHKRQCQNKSNSTLLNNKKKSNSPLRKDNYIKGDINGNKNNYFIPIEFSGAPLIVNTFKIKENDSDNEQNNEKDSINQEIPSSDNEPPKSLIRIRSDFFLKNLNQNIYKENTSLPQEPNEVINCHKPRPESENTKQKLLKVFNDCRVNHHALIKKRILIKKNNISNNLIENITNKPIFQKRKFIQPDPIDIDRIDILTRIKKELDKHSCSDHNYSKINFFYIFGLGNRRKCKSKLMKTYIDHIQSKIRTLSKSEMSLTQEQTIALKLMRQLESAVLMRKRCDPPKFKSVNTVQYEEGKIVIEPPSKKQKTITINTSVNEIQPSKTNKSFVLKRKRRPARGKFKITKEVTKAEDKDQVRKECDLIKAEIAKEQKRIDAEIVKEKERIKVKAIKHKEPSKIEAQVAKEKKEKRNNPVNKTDTKKKSRGRNKRNSWTRVKGSRKTKGCEKHKKNTKH